MKRCPASELSYTSFTLYSSSTAPVVAILATPLDQPSSAQEAPGSVRDRLRAILATPSGPPGSAQEAPSSVRGRLQAIPATSLDQPCSAPEAPCSARDRVRTVLATPSGPPSSAQEATQQRAGPAPGDSRHGPRPVLQRAGTAQQRAGPAPGNSSYALGPACGAQEAPSSVWDRLRTILATPLD